MGVQSKGRVESGRLKPQALRADTQPGCLSSLPHLTPPHPTFFSALSSSQTGLLQEQADHSQTSGLCLLPARCCIGILFAKHSLGFCGLGFGPSRFSLQAASWPKGKERLPWGPAGLRGQALLSHQPEKAQGRVPGLPTVDRPSLSICPPQTQAGHYEAEGRSPGFSSPGTGWQP